MARPAPTFSFRFAGLSPLTALSACAALSVVAPPIWADPAHVAHTVAANDQEIAPPAISAAPSGGLEAWDYRIVTVATTVGAEALPPTAPLDIAFTWSAAPGFTSP